MSMEFDFIWNGHTDTSPEADMFFRIGADADDGGNSCYGNWNRYPALFISSDQDEPSLALFLSEDGHCSQSYDLSALAMITESTSYHIQIEFNMTTLHVSIAEEGVDGNLQHSAHWSRGGTPSEFIGDEVPVWWMSDKFGSTEYEPGNGTFSNIIITSTVPTEEVLTEDLQTYTTSSHSAPDNSSQSTSTSTALNWAAIVIIALSLCLFIIVAMCMVSFCYVYSQRSKGSESDLSEFAIASADDMNHAARLTESEPPSPPSPQAISDVSSPSGDTVNETVDIKCTPRSPEPLKQAQTSSEMYTVFKTKGIFNPNMSTNISSEEYPSVPPTPAAETSSDDVSPKHRYSEGLMTVELGVVNENAAAEMSPLTHE